MALPLLPVTALRPQGSDLLFAACGNHVEVYQDGQRLHAVKVFNRQPVHGLVLALCFDNAPLLLVFGGSLVRAACISSATPSAVALSHLFKADDRILHAAFQPATASCPPPDSHHHAALITAHNRLLRLTIFLGNAEPARTELSLSIAELSAASNSLLYTARLLWLAPSHVLVAAGTAFGDILVWTCVLAPGDRQRPPRCRLHFFFEAHPGSSVFGLDLLHAPRPPSDLHRLLVASCSDERTLRVWDVSAVLDTHISDEQTRPRIDPQLRSDPPPQLAATWAHISRIWHVAFTGRCVSRQSQPALELVSAGEDGTCQLHLLNVGAQLSRNGSSMGDSLVVSNHAGKNIWSLELPELPEAKLCVFTGGADGAIVARSLAPADRMSPDVVETSIERILSSVQQPWSLSVVPDHVSRQSHARPPSDQAATSAKPRIRSVVWTSKNHAILMTTGSGSVVCDASSDSPGWTQFSLLEHLSGHSVSCALPESHDDDVLLAGAKGDVLYVGPRTRRVQHLFKIGQRITSLFAARIAPHAQSISTVDHYAFITPTLGTSLRHVELRLLSVPANIDAEPTVQLLGTLSYEDHDIASFAVLQSTADALSILLGHRGGRLSLYHVPRHSSSPEASVAIPPCAAAHSHTDTITSMHVLTQPFPSSDSTSLHILTTARDASYAIAAYDAAASAFTLLHRCTTPLGPHLEGAALHENEAAPALRLHGFRSGAFIVHDALAHRDLAALPTGGANRLWSYAPSSHSPATSSPAIIPSPACEPPTEALGSLSWIRATHLHTARVQSTPTRVLKAGTHGREIKAAALRPGLFTYAGAPRTLLATGAEDTDVRLHALVDGAWRTTSVLRGHSAGVHCVAWAPDGSRLVSAGGRGELRVWRVQRAPLVGVGVVCECAAHVGPDDVDVRVMGVDVRGGREGEEVLEACVALSDSGLLLLRYDCCTAQWNTMWSGKYSDVCLTQVFFCDAEDQDGATAPAAAAVQIGATASDGRMALWRAGNGLSSSPAPCKTHRIHQSAPKAHLRIALSSTRTLFITASDDNSIALTLFSPATAAIEDDAPFHAETLLLPRAHAASVSALTLLHGMHTQPDGASVARFASAGNDQRVRIWEVRVDKAVLGIEGVQLRRLRSAYTNVADVGSLCVLPPSSSDLNAEADNVLVVGVGIEVLHVPAS